MVGQQYDAAVVLFATLSRQFQADVKRRPDCLTIVNLMDSLVVSGLLPFQCVYTQGTHSLKPSIHICIHPYIRI